MSPLIIRSALGGSLMCCGLVVLAISSYVEHNVSVRLVRCRSKWADEPEQSRRCTEHRDPAQYRRGSRYHLARDGVDAAAL